MTIAKRGEGSKDDEIVLPEPRKGLPGAPRDLLLTGAFIAASAASFGLGAAVGNPFASNQPKESESASAFVGTESVVANTDETAVSAKSSSQSTKKTVGHASGVYVASKNGTKYYLPTCASANRIKEENKIWFLTKEEAEAAGYGPSSTCKGL